MVYDILKKTVKKIFNNKLKKINALKDLHDGETCYIMGTGSSIKEMDIMLFDDKPVIGLNEIIFHKNFINLNKKYLVLTEPFFFYPFQSKFFWKGSWFPIFNPTAKIIKKMAKENKDILFFLHLSNMFFVSGKNIFYNFLKYTHPGFPSRLNDLNCFEGAFKHALSLAVLLGFKKVVLVGCDYTFNPPKGKHFYEKGKGIKLDKKNYHTEFLETIQEFIDLETITLERDNTVLKSREYSNFKNVSNNYKENYELVNQDKLDAIKNTRKNVYHF